MAEENQVKRSLKTRHLSMIALGGSIGTGLFVASGSANFTSRTWWSNRCLYRNRGSWYIS